MDFREWTADSFFSGILDSNAQSSGFRITLYGARVPITDFLFKSSHVTRKYIPWTSGPVNGMV